MYGGGCIMDYDLIVVGMGPSAAFLAYELIQLKTNKKVLLIDQGKNIKKRSCPIEKTGKCMKCKPFCNITCGFSGAGAFSDGKTFFISSNEKPYSCNNIIHPTTLYTLYSPFKGLVIKYFISPYLSSINTFLLT
jgi:choline dehydrogenase-like flavoprotein